MTRMKNGLAAKRSVAFVCCLLGAALFLSGCGRLRGKLAGEATPTAAPTQTQAVTPSVSIVPALTATPVQTAAPEEATPDTAQEETLSGIIDDLNGMQNALDGLDEPSDTDLLVP